jgi:hypothetical protein
VKGESPWEAKRIDPTELQKQDSLKLSLAIEWWTLRGDERRVWLTYNRRGLGAKLWGLAGKIAWIK